MRVRAAMLAMVILGMARLVMAADEWGTRYVVVVAAEMERGEAEALIGVYGGSGDAEQPASGGGELAVRMSPARAEMLRRDPRVVSVVEQRRHLSPRPAGSGSMTLGGYGYDGAGNIKNIGQEQYVYDALGRLVSATAGVTNGQTYEYDAFGNRRSVSRWGSACTGDSSCEVGGTYVPGTNHFNTANGGEYDAAGNLIAYTGSRYVYDATGMMMRSSVGTQDRQYLYTAGDERIAVYDGTTNWRWTVRGADGKVLREFTSTNNGTVYGTLNRQWVKDYIWREGLLLATDSRTGPGTVASHHYHLDHLGTPRLVTDGAGKKVSTHTYYAFGAELKGTAESPETAMKFTGHERDLTGSSDAIDYMHARYYSSLTGRFLSVDPHLDVASNLRRPQRWNRYAYALNNPINLVDPDGRDVVYADEYSREAVEASRKISPGTDAVVKEFEQDKTRILTYVEGDAPDIGRGRRLGQTMTRKDGDPSARPTELIVILDKKDITATGTDRRFVVVHETVGHVKPNSERPRGNQGSAEQREKDAQRRTAEEIRKIPKKDRPKVPRDQEQP